MFYLVGRIFQLLGIIAMPSAMWVAEFERSEKGSIAVFVASILLFLLGWGLTKIKHP